MSILSTALYFSRMCHEGQVRKYTGAPYFSHPVSVMGILLRSGISDEVSLATALLHDVVEDCGVSLDYLSVQFGASVRLGVELLSDQRVPGNRATRKQHQLQRLAVAPVWVKNVKLADLLDNTPSIVLHDAKFAKVYLKEANSLVHQALFDADKKMIETLSNLLYFSAQRI